MRRVLTLLLLLIAPTLTEGQSENPPGVIGYRVHRVNRDPIDVKSCEKVESVYRVVHKDGHPQDLYESVVLRVEPITAENARPKEQLDDETLTRDAPPGNPLGYLVHLADGRTFNASSYWRDGAYYAFKSKGGPERHYRTLIRRIEGVVAANQEARALAARLAFEVEERRKADLKAEYESSIAKTMVRDQARYVARAKARTASRAAARAAAQFDMGDGFGSLGGSGYYNGPRQPGGRYLGGAGSSHKGGDYSNPFTNDRYQKGHR